MALTVQQRQPVIVLSPGVLRRLEGAMVIARLIPPYPAHMLSYGGGTVIAERHWMYLIA